MAKKKPAEAGFASPSKEDRRSKVLKDRPRPQGVLYSPKRPGKPEFITDTTCFNHIQPMYDPVDLTPSDQDKDMYQKEHNRAKDWRRSAGQVTLYYPRQMHRAEQGWLKQFGPTWIFIPVTSSRPIQEMRKIKPKNISFNL